MTEEEIGKKAEEFRSWLRKELIDNDNAEMFDDSNFIARKSYQYGFKDGYSDGYETGKRNERELQCGKKHLENLANENETLKAQIADLKDESNRLRAVVDRAREEKLIDF